MIDNSPVTISLTLSRTASFRQLLNLIRSCFVVKPS